MLTEYTTYADIRAALGVSDEELSDDTLGLDLYLTLLEEEIVDAHASLPAAWDALPADADTWTADQRRFAALFKLFSTFAVAYGLLDSAELFGFLKVADGRASTERVPKSYENLRINITAMYARVKAKLLAALLLVDPGASVATVPTIAFVSAVPGSIDPVTGA